MSAIDVNVPVIGESVVEVTLSTWMVSDGDVVEEGQIICEIESDKATVELPAENSGAIKIIGEEGETYKIGDKIAEIDTSVEPSASAPDAEESAPAPAQDTAAPTSNAAPGGHASPAAKKILDEKGVDAASVQGTGKDGRITKGDALGAQASAPAEAKKADAPAPVTPSGAFSREIRREKMSRLRKTISKRLVEAKNNTALLTTFNEVDMKAIMDMRKKYKERFKEKHGVSLGFMSLFTKACCIALKEIPAVGGMIDGEELVYHDYADVGIAVSTPKGLVVPVVRNAESLTLAEIESEIIRLATKARDGKLTIDEMQGGNFTITNGGVFGSMLSTPIINIPQSGILGMHNIVERPMVVNGEIVIRPVMYIALSYDHRIIDGRESVTFLVRVKELLEDPTRLMLDV